MRRDCRSVDICSRLELGYRKRKEKKPPWRAPRCTTSKAARCAMSATAMPAGPGCSVPTSRTRRPRVEIPMHRRLSSKENGPGRFTDGSLLCPGHGHSRAGGIVALLCLPISVVEPARLAAALDLVAALLVAAFAPEKLLHVSAGHQPRGPAAHLPSVLGSRRRSRPLAFS